MQLTKWTCRQSPTFNKKGTEHCVLWRQRMAHPLFPPPSTTTTTAACKIETESSAWRCSGFRKRYFISICISIHIIWRRIGWSFSIVCLRIAISSANTVNATDSSSWTECQHQLSVAVGACARGHHYIDTHPHVHIHAHTTRVTCVHSKHIRGKLLERLG